MIDFILTVIVLTFLLAVFYAGFWCGKTYGSVRSMVNKAADKIDSKA